MLSGPSHPTAHDVLRAVLLRSELIAPTQADPLIEAIMLALREAGMQVTMIPASIESTAQLDMLDRWGRRE